MGFTQREYLGEEILIPSSLLGFRQWYWKEGSISSFGNSKWTNGSLTSVCERFSVLGDTKEEHSSPYMECSCGIYAHYLPLESYERTYNIFGVIEASGRIFMGTKGFRAEKAKIVALSGYGPCTQWFTTKEKTRGIYPPDVVDFCTSIGVPYFPTVKQMVYEFPQVDLSSLGVPSLEPWKIARDRDKFTYETREKEFKEKLESARAMEDELFRRYGVARSTDRFSASNLMSETLRHLGGWK